MASQSRDMLNQSFLQSYLLQSLNMTLGALMQGETSYTNSFNIIIQEDGFVFVLACLAPISLMMTCTRKSF